MVRKVMLCVLVLMLVVTTTTPAQIGGPPGPPPPPAPETFASVKVEFGYKNPGVNNVMYMKVEALAQGCVPGRKYYCMAMAQGDERREVQPGDFLGKDGPWQCDAQGKILFIKEYDSFNNGNFPTAEFYYSYLIMLVEDNGTPNGRGCDSTHWQIYWLL